MGQSAFPAYELLLDATKKYTLPANNASAAGCGLIDAGDHPTRPNTRVLDWSTRALMLEPASTAGSGTDYRAADGTWKPIPPSVTPGGSSGQLQYNNGGAFAGLSGSSVSGSDLTLGGKLVVPQAIEFGTNVAGPKLYNFGNTRLEIRRNDNAGYKDLWANNLVSIAGIYSNDYVNSALDTIVGRNLELVDATEIRFGTTGKIKQSANVLYLQSASGATFRDMAGTGYVSATAQAFAAQDYVQGYQRVLVGNSSGGRLLPITDGVRIMNWAQTADGALQAGAGTFSGNVVVGNQLTLTPTDGLGTTRITAGNYGILSLGQNGGYLAVNGTLGLIYTASQFSPVATNAIDLGQTGTRFKDGWFQGSVTVGAGTIGVPGIVIGESSTGFYRNAASTLRMTLGGSVSHGWNTSGYETTGYVGFCTGSPGSAVHDVKLSRNATGPAVQVGAAGGLTVTDFAGTTPAQISSGQLNVAATATTADRITMKDDGGATWAISTGGVASTDGIRIVKLGTADIAAFRPSQSVIYTPLVVSPSSGSYGIDVQASGTTAAIRAYSNLGYDIDGANKVPLRLEGVNNGYSGQLRIYPSASQSEYWIFSNGAGQLMEMGTGYIYFNKDLLVGTNIKSVSGGNLVLRGDNGAIHFETGGSPTLRGGVSNGGNFIFGAAPSTDNGTDKVQVTGSIAITDGGAHTWTTGIVTDPLNGSTKALQISANIATRRLFFGSATNPVTLSMGYVNGIENMPGFTTADQNSFGISSASIGICRVLDTMQFANGNGDYQWRTGAGYPVPGSQTLRMTLSNAGNLTVAGSVTSSFQSLSANPTVLDLPVGSARVVKNTSTGVTALWVNSSGTPEIAQSNGLSVVSVDGVTITGNGTPGSPLVASGGGGGGSSSIPTLMSW